MMPQLRRILKNAHVRVGVYQFRVANGSFGLPARSFEHRHCNTGSRKVEIDQERLRLC